MLEARQGAGVAPGRLCGRLDLRRAGALLRHGALVQDPDADHWTCSACMGRLPWWRTLAAGSLMVFSSCDDVLAVEA